MIFFSLIFSLLLPCPSFAAVGTLTIVFTTSFVGLSFFYGFSFQDTLRWVFRPGMSISYTYLTFCTCILSVSDIALHFDRTLSAFHSSVLLGVSS